MSSTPWPAWASLALRYRAVDIVRKELVRSGMAGLIANDRQLVPPGGWPRARLATRGASLAPPSGVAGR
jgi:hypothetical protein